MKALPIRWPRHTALISPFKGNLCCCQPGTHCGFRPVVPRTARAHRAVPYDPSRDGPGQRYPGQRYMDAAETRWVTYAELAVARGIDKASAFRLVKRHKWPCQHGNEGETVRIAVPVEFLRLSGEPTRDETPDKKGVGNGVPTGSSPDLSRDESRLVNVLEDQLERERERADAATALAEQRAGELAKLREQLGKAEGVVEGLQVALAEARRPIWRRLLGR